MAILKDAVEYLDFSKSFRHEGDYIEAIDYLIKEFPVMKMEEWKIICIRLKAGKYGKMYERLKLPELVEIFLQFEGERAERMEKNIKREKEVPPPLQHIDPELLKKIGKSLDLSESDTDNRGRWKFIEHPNTTNEENQLPFSDCCGAETMDTEMGICPDCLEHCEFSTE